MVSDSPQIEGVTQYLTWLQLVATRDRLETLLEQAAKDEVSYLDLLDRVLGEEVAAKNEARVRMAMQIAHFPLQRTLEDFDFSVQPSIDRTLVRELETGRCVAHGDNVLLLGPPGVSKTHLALALGVTAVTNGFSVAAMTADQLLDQLRRDDAPGLRRMQR